jgi:hypothetical protein
MQLCTLALALAVNILAPADSEAAYTQAINKRADDIVALLNISDPADSSAIHQILVNQYRALRDWHDANDARLKSADKSDAAAIRESLRAIHDQFLAALGSKLSAQQIETVKDKMTYGKVKVTYDAYVEIVPTLSSQQKQKILQWLTEAREEAMDAGSAEEKSAVFNRYKGKINNFLSSEGIDMKQQTREWSQRKKRSSSTGPSSQPAK